LASIVSFQQWLQDCVRRFAESDGSDTPGSADALHQVTGEERLAHQAHAQACKLRLNKDNVSIIQARSAANRHSAAFPVDEDDRVEHSPTLA